MIKKFLTANPFRFIGETNSLDAFVPEVWAQESLMILEANMVAANLVHRDFSDEVAQWGDTVNTRLPAEFTAKRKEAGDDVTVQNSTATNVPVVLNQHLYTTFLIRDGEESKGFQTLREVYLQPALLSIAQAIDEIVLGQMHEFYNYRVGKLGTDVTKSMILDARTVLNDNKCPMEGRNMIVTPDTEGALLNISDFVTADKIGDEGTAMREGSLGRKFGFNTFMCQNAPSVADGNTTVAAAVNNSSGYSAGATTIAIDGTSNTLTAGSWCTIGGDMTPQKITSGSGTPTTEITISPGLKYAVSNNAVVTVYTPGTINNTGGYSASRSKALTIADFSVAPKTGQPISFGAGALGSTSPVYSAFGTPTTTELYTNRALDVAVSDGDVVGIGPAGNYNFAFHRNSMALVTRPLAMPAPGTGAQAFVAQYKGLGVRVVITYDGSKQGHRVTVDLLAGIKTLNTKLGCLVYG